MDQKFWANVSLKISRKCEQGSFSTSCRWPWPCLQITKQHRWGSNLWPMHQKFWASVPLKKIPKVWKWLIFYFCRWILTSRLGAGKLLTFFLQCMDPLPDQKFWANVPLKTIPKVWKRLFSTSCRWPCLQITKQHRWGSMDQKFFWANVPLKKSKVWTRLFFTSCRWILTSRLGTGKLLTFFLQCHPLPDQKLGECPFKKNPESMKRARFLLLVDGHACS